ncbi:hypothetical protein KM043_012735 [Ampulex compressa]|nr:hypothetical protein KM043_012735 [Ampulex compressa]
MGEVLGPGRKAGATKSNVKRTGAFAYRPSRERYSISGAFGAACVAPALPGSTYYYDHHYPILQRPDGAATTLVLVPLANGDGTSTPRTSAGSAAPAVLQKLGHPHSPLPPSSLCLAPTLRSASLPPPYRILSHWPPPIGQPGRDEPSLQIQIAAKQHFASTHFANPDGIAPAAKSGLALPRKFGPKKIFPAVSCIFLSARDTSELRIGEYELGAVTQMLSLIKSGGTYSGRNEIPFQ